MYHEKYWYTKPKINIQVLLLTFPISFYLFLIVVDLLSATLRSESVIELLQCLPLSIDYWRHMSIKHPVLFWWEIVSAETITIQRCIQILLQFVKSISVINSLPGHYSTACYSHQSNSHPACHINTDITCMWANCPQTIFQMSLTLFPLI